MRHKSQTGLKVLLQKEGRGGKKEGKREQEEEGELSSTDVTLLRENHHGNNLRLCLSEGLPQTDGLRKPEGDVSQTPAFLPLLPDHRCRGNSSPLLLWLLYQGGHTFTE